jgi:hypothetical protein
MQPGWWWLARTRSGHDTGSITARSVDEVALIRHVISHYAPVLIASLSIHWRSEKIADLDRARLRYASIYPYICKTTDERGNTQMYTAKLDLGRNTITWRGKVFSNLEQMDGCKAAYRATSRDGSTAELCTATQGVADLVVTGDDGSDEFECNIIH